MSARGHWIGFSGKATKSIGSFPKNWVKPKYSDWTPVIRVSGQKPVMSSIKSKHKSKATSVGGFEGGVGESEVILGTSTLRKSIYKGEYSYKYGRISFSVCDKLPHLSHQPCLYISHRNFTIATSVQVELFFGSGVVDSSNESLCHADEIMGHSLGEHSPFRTFF